MNNLQGRSLFFFLIFLGRLTAGEWTHWVGVGGDLASDRSAGVVIRSRHDEGGDQPDLGYRFVYELHNQSGTQKAKVLLYFPVQDPATRRWKEIDRDTPTVVHDLAPLGTVTGRVYAPSVHGLGFESGVKWPEELAVEKERQAPAGEQQGRAPDGVAAGSDSAARQTEFEGVLLSDKVALKEAVDKYTDAGSRFRATIVFQIPPGETSWMSVVDDVAVDNSGTWRQYLDYWFAFVQKPRILAATERSLSYKLKIVSVTASEMTVQFEDLIVDDLSLYLHPELLFNETKPVVLELALLEPAAAPSVKRP